MAAVGFALEDFRKSSFSDPDRECVGLVFRGGQLTVRDTKTSFGSADDRWLTVPAGAGAALLASLRN
jgi:hypothetical protein